MSDGDEAGLEGHKLTTDRVGAGFLRYADLAAGMIEVAEAEPGVYDWKGVCVEPTRPSRFEWKTPGRLIKGFVFHFVPWMYKPLKMVGLA